MIMKASCYCSTSSSRHVVGYRSAPKIQERAGTRAVKMRNNDMPREANMAEVYKPFCALVHQRIHHNLLRHPSKDKEVFPATHHNARSKSRSTKRRPTCGPHTFCNIT